MRKNTIVVLVSFGVLAVVWLMWPGLTNVDAQAGRGGSAGYPPFVGTFLAEFGGAFEGVHCIVQIHPDGTLWHIDQTDQGFGGAADLDSPNLGVWKRTGPFQTTHITLFLNFESSDGLPTTITRGTNVANWDVGFDTASGVATLRLYDVAAGEDPLDPDQGTAFPVEVPWTLRRLVP